MALTHFYARIHLALFKLILVLLYEKHGGGLNGLSEDITKLLLGGQNTYVHEASLSQDILEMITQEDIVECFPEDIEEELSTLVEQLMTKIKTIPPTERIRAIHLYHPNIVDIETVPKAQRKPRIVYGNIHR